MQPLGFHFTIAKGFAYAAKTVHDLGGDTFQFFSRNPRGGAAKIYDEKDVARFHELRQAYNMGPVLAHAPYTINLASEKPEVIAFSVNAVREDILRMDAVGIELFNLHPGSHVGQGLEQGIEKIINGLNECITDESKITILLETMSGKGSEIGFTFEQLKTIMDHMHCPDRVAVCLDTCHVFAAGYDIVNRFDEVLQEFDSIIGLDKLKAVHLNDSMHVLGSKKDRHAPIGEGEIGLSAVQYILNHEQMKNMPFYLETPHDDEGHRAEIAMIRQDLIKL